METCPKCGYSNQAGARFCNNCGSPLEAPRALEGERKLATVLFADVARSTAIAERMDPEDWAAVMQGAFRFMTEAIERYEGIVARLMGDAVLAYFGAPITHENDAERAVRAGLDIRDEAARYAEQLRAQHDIDFGLRVGINTGLTVLAHLGTESYSEYTAMGDTANLASRLQSVAMPGSVVISADTYRLVRHAFDIQPRGQVEVKGKSAPVEVFEVLAMRKHAGSARGVEGLRSPIVGRDAELDLLRGKLAELRAGTGGVVAIVGEAGLGKSRLITELRDDVLAEPDAPRWLEARGVSYGQTVPYQLWHQLGSALIGATEVDHPPALRAKLRAFTERTSLPAEDVPLLEVVLAVETDASRAALSNYDGDQLIREITAAVTRAVRAAIHEGDATRPHVLVFDDAHWADARSLELLAETATLTFGEPLLVICLLRPDKSAPSWATLERLRGTTGSGYVQLELEPLDGSRSGELLGNLLHVEHLPDAVRELILQRSEGNPFFLEEVLRSLIDSGHIVEEHGHWRATSEITTVEIPDTLAGVIAARIDRLPEITKRVAQTAAVLGRVFVYPALSSVCRAAPPPERVDNVDPHLGKLSYEELVRERGRTPEREFIFKHALTQETAYGLLLRRRRAELHAISGRVLEELYQDRLEEYAPVLAHHFQRGGDLQRTAEYSRRAAERALQLYALREADEHYANAHAAYEALLDSDQPQHQKYISTTLDWTVARYKLKRYDMVDRLLHAEQVARAIDDKHRLAEVLSWIAMLYMVSGAASHAEPYLMESSALATQLGKDTLLLLPFFVATDAMIDRNPAEAATRMQEVVELARRNRMPEIEGHALASTAIAYTRTGDFDRARDFIAQALAAKESGGHRVKEADVYLLVGLAYVEMGEPEKALEYSRLGTRMAQQENAFECTCFGYYSLGVEDLALKDPGAAEREFLTSLEFADRVGWRGWQGFANRIRAGLASAHIASGVEDAVGDLETALDNAKATHDDYGLATLSERLAAVHVESGRIDAAAGLIDGALEYYRVAGMPVYEARALDVQARVADARGHYDEARSARERAVALRSGVTRSHPAEVEA